MTLLTDPMPPFETPGPPGWEDTSLRREVLRALQSKRWEQLCAPHIAQRLFRHIRIFLCALLRIEERNQHIISMWNLRRDPELRAQVRDDLGGEAALDRWDARFSRAQERLRDTRNEFLHRDTGGGALKGRRGLAYVPHRPVPKNTTVAPSDYPPDMVRDLAPSPGVPVEERLQRRKCLSAITDRSGLYRLAPLPRMCEQPGRVRTQSRTHKPKTLTPSLDDYQFKPLGLRPSDLRAPEAELAEEDDKTAPIAARGLSKKLLNSASGLGRARPFVAPAKLRPD